MIAQTLEEFAEIYVHRKRSHTRGVLEQYEKHAGPSHLGNDGVADCRYNLLQVAQMEENPTDDSIRVLSAMY